MTMNDTIVKSPIKSLFAELAQVDGTLRDLPPTTPDAEYVDLCERHWALREQIAVTPVASLEDQQWIASALILEMERDPDFSNHGDGSARGLALALADVALQLAGAAQ